MDLIHLRGCDFSSRAELVEFIGFAKKTQVFYKAHPGGFSWVLGCCAFLGICKKRPDLGFGISFG